MLRMVLSRALAAAAGCLLFVGGSAARLCCSSDVFPANFSTASRYEVSSRAYASRFIRIPANCTTVYFLRRPGLNSDDVAVALATALAAGTTAVTTLSMAGGGIGPAGAASLAAALATGTTAVTTLDLRASIKVYAG